MADPKNQPTNGIADPSLTLADLQTELSTLNRVSHRLAMTDAGPALEKVLNLLLPRMLQRIGKNDDTKKKNRRSNINKRKSPPSSSATSESSGNNIVLYDQIDGMHETIHKKVIEMLGHTMKRVREDRGCKLPCAPILDLLIPTGQKLGEDAAVNPWEVNLGLAFLTLGINRCTAVECTSLLPGLLKLLGCNYESSTEKGGTKAAFIGVGYLMDPSRKMRHDQTWHLILRCLESISQNPMENAASRRATQKSGSSVSNSSVGASSENSSGLAAPTTVVLLHDTKQDIASNPILAAALFDLFVDVFLYSPVPATSTLIPNGLSTAGYQRLIGGAASENSSGCKNWREEFAARASLRLLKLKLLDLIAPCRRYALFLQDKPMLTVTDAVGRDKDEKGLSQAEPNSIQDLSGGMGVSRTVALMVLLSSDSDRDVKSKAESYLRAHMDTYRGKEVSQTNTASTIGDTNGESATPEITVHDALLGDSVALAQQILVFAQGGASSLNNEKSLKSQYKNEVAVEILKSRLGLTHCADASNVTQQKAFLSCSRMKMSEMSATSALKFVGKMLDDNPRLFHVGMDMEEEESDIAAVSIGTLSLSVFGDFHRPGSSASSAMDSVASLINSLCVRLSLFYDARVESSLKMPESLERIRLLLARSMKLVCSVLAPTSSGESTSLSSNGTKASTVQVDIRDKCYGVICTSSRSHFALDDRHALFDCGNSSGRPNSTSIAASSPLTTISTALLLFGCSSNEVEMLRPRATSALDALLGAYVRVVKLLNEKEKALELEQEAAVNIGNPWENVSELSAKANMAKKAVSTESLSRSLLPLLWSAARRSQPKSSRLAAARWSSELLLCLDDSNALHLLCFLSGDDDATVSMIAKQAIGIEKLLGEDNILTTDLIPSEHGTVEHVSTHRATFSVLIDVIIGSQPSTKSRPRYANFHVRAQAATLRFLLVSLFSEDSFYGDEDGGLALKEFVCTILKTMAFYKGRSLSREEIDLLDECSISLASCTSTSNDARSVVVRREGVASDTQYDYKDIALQALTSNSSKTRRHLAKVMGHLYEDHSLWDVDFSTKSLFVNAWLEKSGIAKIARNCSDKVSTMFGSSFALGEVHGAAFLGSSCVRSFRLAIAGKSDDDQSSNIADCWKHCCSIVSFLGKGLAHSDTAIGNACSKGLVIAFSYDDQDAPILNQRLFDSMAVAIDSMNSALKKYSSIDHADPTRASSLIQAAGLLLAASTYGAGFTKGAVLDEDGSISIDLGPARLQCTESLFAVLGSAVYRKDDELSLIVGEALVKYADAVGTGDWSSGTDSELKEGPYDEAYAFNLPPHQHILYTMFRRELLSSNPMKRNSCAATLLALIGHASHTAHINPSSTQRAFIQEIRKNLILFQGSFIKLLADPKSKQLSRESCCKGLAGCRGLAAAINPSEVVGESLSQSLNAKLLKTFGQTTKYAGSAMQETETEASQRRNEADGNNETNGQETQAGGAAGMSEATLGAYREMSSAALSLGHVDVLYSLMILSTNHPLWLMPEMRDRYSAKALLGKAEGESVDELRVSLRPHLGKLIPKLLRACNDPDKQTREQMSNLWLALAGGGAESRAIVSQNLLPTMDVLIQDAGSKFWRARVGACGALSDIIIGRSWQDLGGGGIEVDDEGSGMMATASIRLIRLWKITMRALDDVRTPVRERGESLGRGIRALTIRLCDPTVSDVTQDSDIYMSNTQRKLREKQSEISAEYAATVSLGWLVKYGLNQQCAEATGICISCLLGIVDVAAPCTVQPVLAELIGSLLMAMSGLEPAALNYLTVRAAGNDTNLQGNTGPDRYDQIERLRINLALSGPIAGALHKCLEMVKFVDLEAQKRLIPELDSSLRKGAGFATRAATADAVGTLCGTCPAAFYFAGSTMSNPTVRLLRALYFASERERGATAKDKMTHALGSLAELAPGKAVRILSLKACERYSESSGSNNDPSIRKAAAATIRAIAVRASNHMADGGPKDIWCRKVLPTAFLGRHDKDAKISSLWKEVWDEGGSAINSMDGRDGVFGVLLQEKLLPYIVKSTVLALQSTSWANRKTACAVMIELSDANVVAPISRSTIDDSSFSTEDIDRLRQRAKSSTVLLSECMRIVSRNRIWDGKGDVVNAGAMIAGKWAITPVHGKNTEFSEKCIWPLVLSKECHNDLFVGDGWFNLSEGKQSDENDEVGCDDANNDAGEMDELNSEDDTALDLSGDNDLGDDEQLNGEHVESDVEGKFGAHSVVFSGFCRVLLDQALRAGSNNSTEGVLPYKASALSGLTALLKSVVPAKDSAVYDDIVEHQHFMYDLIAPSIYSFVLGHQFSSGKSVPPLLIARSLECLASAMYDGIGSNAIQGECSDAVGLLKYFALSTGSKQPAWTVRQMSALAASSLVANMQSSILRKNEIITTVIECSTQALKDKKFWKVRLAGLELLLSLVSRVGNQKMSDVDSEKQLIMEAILPYKERIVAVARKSLADNESQVTATASKITLTMAWWP